MEAGRGKPRLDGPLGDRVEYFERGDQGAGLVELDFQRTARHLPEVLGEDRAALAHDVERAGEGARHLPADLLLGGNLPGQDEPQGEGTCQGEERQTHG